MILLQVEVAHTDLSEVTRVVFIDVCTVVVLYRESNRQSAIIKLALGQCREGHEASLVPYLTTSHTTTTRMLSVLSDASVTSTDVATVLPCLAESGRHLDVLT